MTRGQQQRAARRSRDLACRLFSEAKDQRDTLGEHYLEIERGFSGVLDDMFALTLRLHPARLFRDHRKLAQLPALICASSEARAVMGACGRLGELGEVESQALRDPELIVASRRIRLTSDGRKRERRSLGAIKMRLSARLGGQRAGTQRGVQLSAEAQRRANLLKLAALRPGAIGRSPAR